MKKKDLFIKRTFDIFFSVIGIFFISPIIIIAWVIATIDTRSNGFFLQTRIGKNAKPFKIIKIKTMIPHDGNYSTITQSGDERITKVGSILRRFKIDELPQIINVLLGQMSFVGPRPDVPGYADKIQGKDREFLRIRPGITGPAAIKYRNEENILSLQKNAQKYNDEIIWPDKIKINIKYIKDWSFKKDLQYIFKTFRTFIR